MFENVMSLKYSHFIDILRANIHLLFFEILVYSQISYPQLDRENV